MPIRCNINDFALLYLPLVVTKESDVGLFLIFLP